MSLPPPRPAEDAFLSDRMLSVRHAPGRSGVPKAVFIHGLGGSSLNWTDLMLLMADDVDGYAVDLHGFGGSPPSRDGGASPEDHARAVATFIDEVLGGEAVHVLGNSLGGAVALQLAARRPDLARSLTLVSPALPSTRITRSTMHMPVIAIPGVGDQFMGRYRQLPVRHRVLGTIELCMVDPSRLPRQRVEEAIADQASRDDVPYVADEFLRSLRGLLATYLDRSSERPWKLAERVTCPTLAVYGLQDPLVDPKSAHRITKHFRNADVLVITDSGHVAQMEHPELVYEAWKRVCAERPAP